MSTVVYFAYGSNMSQRRLQARVPSAEFQGIGILAGHAIAFHMASNRDGSAKCDVIKSETATVYGALFKMAAAELSDLDACEGKGNGYERRIVTVENRAGSHVDAWIYVATHTDPRVRPYTWYKYHVLEGAREANLPIEYQKFIEATKTVKDPDRQRASNELAIYD